MVSHWSFSDSKFSQVSRTFLSIVPNLNNAVVSMVSTSPLISMSSTPCTRLLVTVQRAPITIGITFILMLYCFYRSLARSRYLSLFVFFQFDPVISWIDKVHKSAGSLFCWLSLGLVVTIIIMIINNNFVITTIIILKFDSSFIKKKI